MTRIADTFGEKIGMSRRDIYRLARELTLDELDKIVQIRINVLPLLAGKKRLWPKVDWPLEPGQRATPQRENALRALIFMQIVRSALPPKYRPTPKSSKPAEQEEYIRKILQTREAALQAAISLPMSLSTFTDLAIPAIWHGNDGTRLDVKIRNGIKKRLESLEQYTQNAFVAGYPEWQGHLIFQKDVRLKFADDQKRTGVIYFLRDNKQVFPTREEFHQFIAESTTTKKRKHTDWQPPKRPIQEKTTRNGPPQNINGIDAAEFMERFAFRGGEFGTWLTQKDRQLSLEWATSAFMDLSAILGIHEKNIGRNSLAFAFGARGVGGIQAAAAHYDTVFNVVNLTKLYGAGSAAHEWAHFIDFKVLRPKGVGSDTMTWLYGHEPLHGTELVAERRKNLVKMEERIIDRLKIFYPDFAEMAEKYFSACPNWEAYLEYFTRLATLVLDEPDINYYLADIQENIEPLVCCRESDFHANAKLLDKRRWHPYWSLPHELFARAFEKFVMDKLSAKGMHNDYLVKLYEHKISPYPHAAEMELISPKLEEIIDLHIRELS